MKSITSSFLTEDNGILVKFLLINGPNLNMLGKREPDIYGSRTLDDIVEKLRQLAQQQGIELDHLQSNAEHEIVSKIQQAMAQVDFIIINPGAFTHTSIAIRDALLSVSIPFIEIHLSNVHARETFRRHSYLSDVAQGVICGLGDYGYEAALIAAKRICTK
jgi:3-dehydroquinate dehydratase-2